MTNLSDFLKVKQVRCIDGVAKITTGKVYDVIGLDETCVHVTDDDGEEACYWYCRFEPVLDSAETPLQNIELTPEFEVVEPTFKVGDKVYKYGETDVKTVLEVFEDGHMRISKYPYRVNHEVICHATPENHAMLSKPYPHIKFERPPITGDDLLEAMLKKGIKNVLCFDKHGNKHVITDKAGIMFVDIDGFNSCSGLTPIDWTTDEPLTEAVLDE